MGKWKIFHADGAPLKDENSTTIETLSLDYNGSWMGECSVSITFKNPAPILFKIGDYLIYRNEKFEINYDPGKIKQSRRDTYGEAFVYENVKFNAKQDELARTEFLDIVLHDNQLHYTSLTKFSFYVSSLDDLLDRIQANLNEQWGFNAWKLYSRNKLRSLQRGCDENVWVKTYGNTIVDNVIKSTSIIADGLNCWSALALVNSKFDINFITRGRNVFVGTIGLPTAHLFEYGKNNGLYQIEQNADSEQAIVTRLRAYGSTKNLPNRYYATLNLQVFGVIDNIKVKQTGTSLYTEFILDLKFKEYLFFNELTQYSSPSARIFYVKIKIGGHVANARVFKDYDSDKIRVYSEYVAGSTDPDDNTDQPSMTDFVQAVNIGARVYFITGVKKEQFPVTSKDYATENLPNNMAVDHLMLPGFPNKSLQQWWNEQDTATQNRIYSGTKQHIFSTNKYRPFIDSANIGEIGVRPSSVYFDSEDIEKGIEEIYPTIEKMEVNGVRIDEVLSAQQIEDNGVFRDGATIPNFKINLKSAINFDINELMHNSTEQPYIAMKDGMCGARQFKIAAARKLRDNTWELTCERVLDDALQLYFPYNDYQIKPNDHFVLIGIPLPDSYVEAASIKLLQFALRFIDKNDYTRYIYSPKIDEIFMQRQHDKAIADTTGNTISLHDTIKEGDQLAFEDNDLHIQGNITIDQLSIHESENKIPTYDVTLREDKSVGTIQKMQERINSLESGNGALGTESGITMPQIQRLIETFGGKRFLSKLNPDTAQAVITFLKGLNIGTDYSINELGEAVLKAITSKDFNALEQAGFGITQRRDGKYQLSITDLIVWGKAVFNELEIRKLSYVGGNFVFSACGSKIKRVVDNGTTWRCYFHQDDGTTATTNLWDVDDQARCQTFNIRAGVYAGVSNRNYWRRVMAKGEDYIDLSKTDCEQGSDAPQVDDTLVQFGNRTKTDRQSLIQVVTIGDEAPAIVWYSGVNSYSLTGKTSAIISPSKVEFSSDLFRLKSRNGNSVPFVADRGTFTAGEQYGYYDRVSHDGRLWLCVAPVGTIVTSAPSMSNPQWQLQVDRGSDGSGIRMEINSDMGSVLYNGRGTITLTAHIYEGNTETTANYAASKFSWVRVSTDTAGDTAFNTAHVGVGNSISVNRDDVLNASAKFECILNN